MPQSLHLWTSEMNSMRLNWFRRFLREGDTFRLGTAMRENISPAGAPPRAAPGNHPTSGISHAGVSAALKTPTRYLDKYKDYV